MARWISHPVQLPASAPEELKKASIRWKKPESVLALEGHEYNEGNTSRQVHQLQKTGEPQSRKRKRGIKHDLTSTNLAVQQESSTKEHKTSDSSLAAALQRMYPPREVYHVKKSHTVRPDQWHPIDETTQEYHPNMRQPLDRQISWNDHGITQKTGGKVPHETVLDFLVDAMRNKHWRGDITTINPDNHKLTWPRLCFYELTKLIASNPFLLRLSQLLEGRFTAASSTSSHRLPYVPAITVHGHTNRSAPIRPRYIAAILIQALGKENPNPCSLCAGELDIDSGVDPRPFATCTSLASSALPPRFKACGNHFWIAGVTDCSHVSVTAPLHQDERYTYFFEDFACDASNYPLIRDMFHDEFLER